MAFNAPKWETVSYSGRGRPSARALLAPDGAAVAAVLFRAVRRPDRGSGVRRRILEHRAAEVLRGRHPPLPHEVDQRRRPVLGDAQFPEDHGRRAEQPHHVGARPVEPLPVRDGGAQVAVHRDGLEVLPSQDGAQAAASHRVPLAHHDAGEEDPVFPGGADGGDATAVRQGAHRLAHALRPQVFGGEQLLSGGGDGEHHRAGASPLDEDREESRGAQAPREPAPRGAVVHGPRQGGAGDDGKASGRRRRGPAQGADGEDDRHRRIERGKGVAPAEQAHAEAAPPEVRAEELRRDLLPPHPPGGEVDDEHMFSVGEGHPPLYRSSDDSPGMSLGKRGTLLPGGDIPGSYPGRRKECPPAAGKSVLRRAFHRSYRSRRSRPGMAERALTTK